MKPKKRQFPDVEGGVSARHIVKNYHFSEAMGIDPKEKQRLLKRKAQETEGSALGKSIMANGYDPSIASNPVLATRARNVWRMPEGDTSSVILDGHHRIAYMNKIAPDAKVFTINRVGNE